MNSEVGTGSADFTYIKKAVCFEVGTWNANFETTKVGIRSADFRTGWVLCFQVEVGTQDADFRTVKVGIRSADFLFFSVRLLLEVGKWIADFCTVEVGNPDADFISIMHSNFFEGFYN